MKSFLILDELLVFFYCINGTLLSIVEKYVFPSVATLTMQTLPIGCHFQLFIGRFKCQDQESASFHSFCSRLL